MINKFARLSAVCSFVLTTQLISIGTNAKTVSIMQYNVENLFDTVPDPDNEKADEEFTPEGKMQWTQRKLNEKFENLARVLKTVTGENDSVCPDVLTLEEVENEAVLRMWMETSLKDCRYLKDPIVNRIEPDPRGIRVAMFSKYPLLKKHDNLTMYNGGRFIIEATILVDEHPLTIFINHWKSRARTGSDGGEGKRIQAAKVVYKRIQQIHSQNPDADYVITGDLNDEPENKSLTDGLHIKKTPQEVVDSEDTPLLWQPSYELMRTPLIAKLDEPEDKEKAFRILRSTYYYAAEKAYNQIDHILLSRGLFDEEGFSYVPGSYQVVRLKAFTDPRTKAPIPYHAMENEAGELVGPRGASDHFPIVLKLKLNSAE